MIPRHLAPFFWDINTHGFDPLAYPEYTIARVLEWGDVEAVTWLKGTFDRARIVEVLCAERRLSRKSANFWALVYGIPPEQVAALQSRDEVAEFSRG
jgi:hypothetical protein